MIVQITKTCLRFYNGIEKLKNVIMSSCSSQCSVVVSGVNCGIGVGGWDEVEKGILVQQGEYMYYICVRIPPNIPSPAPLGQECLVTGNYILRRPLVCTRTRPHCLLPRSRERLHAAYCTEEEALSRVPRLGSENVDFAKVVVGRVKNPGLTPFSSRSPSSESQNWYSGQ